MHGTHAEEQRGHGPYAYFEYALEVACLTQNGRAWAARFDTLEATSRYWHDVRTEEDALESDARPRVLSRSRRRIASWDHWWWQIPDRVRIETHVATGQPVPVDTVIVGDGLRWWSHHGTGTPVTNDPAWALRDESARLVSNSRNAAKDSLAEWVLLGRRPLFAWIAWQEGATVSQSDHLCRSYTGFPGATDFARMPALVPWFPGGERYTLVVDEQYGLVLKVSAWLNGREASVWEVTRIRLDEALRPSLFEPP